MVEKYGKTIEAVFIRRAQPVEKTPGFSDEIGRDAHLSQWRDQRIHFFDTYIGAAVQALGLELIKPEGLFKVVRSSQQMFLDLDSPSTLEEWRATERRRTLLNRDTREARQVLRAKAVEAKDRVNADVAKLSRRRSGQDLLREAFEVTADAGLKLSVTVDRFLQSRLMEDAEQEELEIVGLDDDDAYAAAPPPLRRLGRSGLVHRTAGSFEGERSPVSNRSSSSRSPLSPQALSPTPGGERGDGAERLCGSGRLSPVALGRSASGLLSVSPRRRNENMQLLDVMHEWDQHLGALPPKPHPIGPARRTGERVLTIYGTGVVRRWHAMQEEEDEEDSASDEEAGAAAAAAHAAKGATAAAAAAAAAAQAGAVAPGARAMGRSGSEDSAGTGSGMRSASLGSIGSDPDSEDSDRLRSILSSPGPRNIMDLPEADAETLSFGHEAMGAFRPPEPTLLALGGDASASPALSR